MRTGLEVDCHVELADDRGHANERLVDELEVGVYRIVQEALANAVKHGAAEHARVEVVERDQQVRVIISDDGHGFDPRARTAGFGLMGMRERSDLLGGQLSSSRRPPAARRSARTLRRYDARRAGPSGELVGLSG